MRGEYEQARRFVRIHAELPPHARRIQIVSVTVFKARGTTSACAENTSRPTISRHSRRNYLRMRGEYPRV